MDPTDPARPDHQDGNQASDDEGLLDQILQLIFNELPTTDLFSPQQVEALRQLADARRLHRPDAVIEILQAE